MNVAPSSAHGGKRFTMKPNMNASGISIHREGSHGQSTGDPLRTKTCRCHEEKVSHDQNKLAPAVAPVSRIGDPKQSTHVAHGRKIPARGGKRSAPPPHDVTPLLLRHHHPNLQNV